MQRAAAGFLLVLAAGCGGKLRDGVQPLSYDLRLATETVVLPNGVRVVVLPDNTTDLVAVVARYAVGASTDSDGKQGRAHLAEHVSYEQRPAGGKTSILTELRARALLVNATTSPSRTEFVALARPSELGRLLELEAARLAGGCSATPPETFSLARTVVVQEARERGVHGRGGERARASMFPSGHPWAHTLLEQEIQADFLSLADVCQLMAEQYIPAKLTLVIAGRVTAAEALRLAETSFRAVPVAPAPVEPPPFPSSPVSHAQTFTFPGIGAAVYVAWPLPSDLRGEEVAFLLAVMSEQNDRIRGFSRFTLGYDVDVVGEPPYRYLLVNVSLLARDQVKPVLEALEWATAEPLYEGVRFEWLRYSLLVDLYLSWEGLLPRAQAAAAAAEHGGDPSLGTYLRRIRDVRPAAVRAARDRVFQPERAIVRILVPGVEQAEASSAARPPSRPAPPAAQTEEPEPDAGDAMAPARPRFTGLRAVTLDNGLQVMLLPRRSAVPVVSARLVFFAGSAHAPPGRRVLADATPALLEPSPRRYTVGDMELVEDPLVIAGARRFLHVTADTTTFGADGLDESLAQLLEGLEGWPTAAIEPSRELGNAAIAFIIRRLPILSDLRLRALVEESVFGAAHPYGSGGHAAPKDSDDVFAQLRGWQRQRYCAQNAALVVAGAFDDAAAEDLIRRLFGGWSRCARTPPVRERAPRRAAPAFLGVVEERPTVDVILAWPTAPAHDAGRAARLVLSELLRSQMAIIRERLGASYGVSVGYDGRVGGGMHVVAGALDAARAAEGLNEMRRRVEELFRYPAARHPGFAAAKRAVLSRLVADIDETPALADLLVDLAVHGVGPEDRPALVDEVERLTPEAVAILAREELDPRQATVLVRGAREVLGGLRWDGLSPQITDSP